MTKAIQKKNWPPAAGTALVQRQHGESFPVKQTCKTQHAAKNMCIVVLKWLRTNCVFYLKKCMKRYPQKTCNTIGKSLKIIKKKNKRKTIKSTIKKKKT